MANSYRWNSRLERENHSEKIRLAWKRPESRRKYLIAARAPKSKKFLLAASETASWNNGKRWHGKNNIENREKVSQEISARNKKRWKDAKYRAFMIGVLKKAKRARLRGFKKSIAKNKTLWAGLMSKTVRRLRKDPEYLRMVMRSHVRISKPQISIFKSLCARGFRGLKLEYFVTPYSIDIAFPEYKVAIEVDGAYWHKNKEKDKLRDRFLKQLGWKIIRVLANLSVAPTLAVQLRRVL